MYDVGMKHLSEKKKEVALKLNAWGQDEKTAKQVRKHLREVKKQQRIAKLVQNAPKGSALRPWNYDKRQYE